MNNVDEVIQVILIGLTVASFLLNTNRFLKAIELCKECLFILKDGAGIKKEKLSKLFYKGIYVIMWKACSLISDNTNTIKYAESILQICHENGERLEECELSIEVANIYFHQCKYPEAIQLSEKALLISREVGDRKREATCHVSLGDMYVSVGEHEKAKEHLEKSLTIHKDIGDRKGEATSYVGLGNVYVSVCQYEKARERLEKSLAIQKEIGDRKGEAASYVSLGIVYQSVGEYEKAREHLEKSLAIQKEIEDRNGEAASYVNLGNLYVSVGEYEKASEHLEKSLAIQKEIGDRKGETASYVNLGNVYVSVGEYEKAREHLEKSLEIKKEIGDKEGEAASSVSLGIVYQSGGEYEKAREHLEKSLAIQKEIGDRKGEAASYANLGTVYESVGEYEKAREHLEKSLAIQKEIGDRKGEAASYVNLGNVYASFGEHKKAREHLEISLATYQKIGSRHGEALSYGSLGTVYQSVGEYEKARKHHEKSLAIQKEIGDKEGEVQCYTNLGNVYASVGEYEKASDCWEKSLAFSRRTGNRFTLVASYHHLGLTFYHLGKYSKANEYNQKALAIFTDIGHREGIASSYLNQGLVEYSVGSFIKARECFEKALAISKEIGNRDVEATAYSYLGGLFANRAEYDRGEECIKKALALSEAIGDIQGQLKSLDMIARLRVEKGEIPEAMSYFLSAIKKSEKMRCFLRDNDQFKISLFHHNIGSYRHLSMLLCETGNPIEALHVSELSKARALADLLAAQYSTENPLTRTDIKGIVATVCNRTCLFVSYHIDSIYLWILKAGRVAHFQRIEGNEMCGREGLSQQLKEFFDFRSFGILPEGICEDRSLHSSQPESKSREEDSHDDWRLGNESKANQGPKMNLPICYKLIIDPVVHFLEGPEIIIVPDRALYQIPFAALTDESGKYISETFRIRIVPSLTTLKLISESPADYHCQTGALIVGNPDVGEVHFKGKLKNISRLQCAEDEAKMIGKKLGVEPLLGQQATKQAVLQAMNSVALIHIAAHGDAERGEIAFAPSFRIPNGIPQEGLYLLTMTDISKIQLRAKLVVLSCCHSARGQTKAEGAVGIARAFLGSGARSVLVSLWALDDKATEQFMTHFYDHLVAGDSAGASLHEAMKWMRSKGYDVNQWAPFILIGDDVTFEFGKKGKVIESRCFRFSSYGY